MVTKTNIVSFDVSDYRYYSFKDLGRGERVEVLAIPSSSQHSISQRKVLNLELVINLARCMQRIVQATSSVHRKESQLEMEYSYYRMRKTYGLAKSLSLACKYMFLVI